MKTIVVRVTQQDIDSPRSSFVTTGNVCPMGCAIERAIGAEVTLYKDRGFVTDTWEYFDLPEDAVIFGFRFDQGFWVEPFTFTISVEATQ